MELIPLSEYKPESIEWLWPGRLALGSLTMLDGDPGIGKSLITLDLCARVTRLPFPPCPPLVKSSAVARRRYRA